MSKNNFTDFLFIKLCLPNKVWAVFNNPPGPMTTRKTGILELARVDTPRASDFTEVTTTPHFTEVTLTPHFSEVTLTPHFTKALIF